MNSISADNLAILILTKNEELHIDRCLNNAKKISKNIYIIDSYSDDDTIKIAESHGCTVLKNEWINYSEQFNFGLSVIKKKFDWVIRLDADEYFDDELVQSILTLYEKNYSDIVGFYVNRTVYFNRVPIVNGGLYPVPTLRIFKAKIGVCESRWMDEHIDVVGRKELLNGNLIDDNLNSISWWISKHNNYANREAIDLLDIEYNFSNRDFNSVNIGIASRKRTIKEKIYSKIPLGFRAFLYFFYRYVLRLGFMDSAEARQYHILQGFWYRYLVDCKVYLVQKQVRSGVDIKAAIRNVLGIKV